MKSVVIPAAPDTTAPTTTATLNPDLPGSGGWYGGPVTVSLSATDGGGSGVAGTQYAVDGGAWTAYSAPVVVSGDGNHTVVFRSTDVAGNVEADRSVSLKIDGTAPVSAAEVSGNDPVTVTLSGADATAGLAGIEYRIGSGAWTAYTAPFTVTKTAAAQVISFRSTDNAGNVETVRSITVPAAPVQPAASTTSLTIPVGATLTTTTSIKVNVAVTAASGSPSGTVFVTVDGNVVGAGTLVGGQAQVTVAGLPAGTHQLVASFPGDASLAASQSSPQSITVLFGDYSSGQFLADVQWLVEQGITTGNADGGFAPNAPVTRQAMAAFLFRLTHDEATAPACSTAPFRDVPAGSQFCGEIAWLATTGVTNGYADGTFRPGAPVARDAMAAFLYRLANGGGTAPACSTAPFTDVPVGSPFCGEIAWLKAAGISTGNADGSFSPASNVSRQAMAAFLHRYATR